MRSFCNGNFVILRNKDEICKRIETRTISDCRIAALIRRRRHALTPHLRQAAPGRKFNHRSRVPAAVAGFLRLLIARQTESHEAFSTGDDCLIA
jgi:hypothetical protein